MLHKFHGLGTGFLAGRINSVVMVDIPSDPSIMAFRVQGDGEMYSTGWQTLLSIYL